MSRAVLDLRRAALLAWACVRFGGGPLIRRLLRLPPRGPSGAVRLRLAMERLGLTYLKLGQFLAMRFDVLPAHICEELSTLFDTVPPTTFEVIEGVVESELGRPLDVLFAEFERDPLAAGSVAQVHRARTHEGQLVAVKVQRPGIRPTFEADVRNFRRIATVVDALGAVGFVSISDMLDDFATWTRREMEFTLEATTADRLRGTALPYEVVPEVFWELTTAKVMTMEYLDGLNAVQVQSLVDRGGLDLLHSELPRLDLELAMRRLAFVSLRQLFVTGFFHGDPHPGNVIFLPDNRVAYVDFGIFGEFSTSEREIWRRHFESFSIGDIRESVYQYCKLLIADPDGDLVAFQRDAYEVLTRMYLANLNPETPLEERHVARSSAEVFELLRKHRLRVTLNNLLFWRTLVALTASAYRLSPQFDLLGVQREFFAEYSPDPADEIWRIVRKNVQAHVTAHLEGELAHVGQVLAIESRGDLELRAMVGASEPVEEDHNRHARGLTVALVGLSLALAGAATPWEASWRVAVLGLAVPLLAWSLTWEPRR